MKRNCSYDGSTTQWADCFDCASSSLYYPGPHFLHVFLPQHWFLGLLTFDDIATKPFSNILARDLFVCLVSHVIWTWGFVKKMGTQISEIRIVSFRRNNLSGKRFFWDSFDPYCLMLMETCMLCVLFYSPASRTAYRDEKSHARAAWNLLGTCSYRHFNHSRIGKATPHSIFMSYYSNEHETAIVHSIVGDKFIWVSTNE